MSGQILQGPETVYKEMEVRNIVPLATQTAHCLPPPHPKAALAFPVPLLFSPPPSPLLNLPFLNLPPPCCPSAPILQQCPGPDLTLKGTLYNCPITPELQTAAGIHRHDGPYAEQSLPWSEGEAANPPHTRWGGAIPPPPWDTLRAPPTFFSLPTGPASAWSTSILAPLTQGTLSSVDHGSSCQWTHFLGAGYTLC